MTKFTGPLYVGRLDSDTTAVTIDVSGTATFAGGLNVAGNAVVSGNATFSGTIQETAGLGLATFVREVTVAQANTAGAPATISLPTSANIVDVYLNVEIPFANAAGVTAAAVRVSADNVGNVVEFNVSASTIAYRLGGANTVTYGATQVRQVVSTLEGHVSIQGSNTALTIGQAILGVVYIRN